MPGTLQVDFIANYTGNHRVCWRIGTSGPYDCITIVPCAGLGALCSAYISVDLSAYNVQCDDIIFEGYVQPTCYPELSTDGRFPFSVLYTPIWPCVFWEATRDAGPNPILNFGDDCAGNPLSIESGLVGSVFKKCGPELPIPTSPNWTIVERTSNCCYDCRNVEFRNSSISDATLYYIDCTTLAVVVETVPAGITITRCIVNTSETVKVGTLDITYLGVC